MSIIYTPSIGLVRWKKVSNETIRMAMVGLKRWCHGEDGSNRIIHLMYVCMYCTYSMYTIYINFNKHECTYCLYFSAYTVPLTLVGYRIAGSRLAGTLLGLSLAKGDCAIHTFIHTWMQHEVNYQVSNTCALNIWYAEFGRVVYSRPPPASIY
jgi:hypothetical protein